MPISFLPAYRTEALTDVTAQWLRQQDIRLLMLDFDNTIVPYTTNVPTAEMDAWLRAMVASDIDICVVSNSRNERVKNFCKDYGIICITRAKKPGTRGIFRARQRFRVPVKQAALAGDQIFTDTLGANLSGVRAILVRPIHNHNIWLKARHVLEQPFIFLARNRRITHE